MRPNSKSQGETINKRWLYMRNLIKSKRKLIMAASLYNKEPNFQLHASLNILQNKFNWINYLMHSSHVNRIQRSHILVYLFIYYYYYKFYEDILAYINMRCSRVLKISKFSLTSWKSFFLTYNLFLYFCLNKTYFF